MCLHVHDCRYRRRISSLENINEMLANDGLSNKPKEDRIVKFKDPDDMKDGSHRTHRSVKSALLSNEAMLQALEEFSRRFSDTNNGKESVIKPPSKTTTVSILKDPTKGKGSKDPNDLKPKESTMNDTRSNGSITQGRPNKLQFNPHYHECHVKTLVQRSAVNSDSG